MNKEQICLLEHSVLACLPFPSALQCFIQSLIEQQGRGVCQRRRWDNLLITTPNKSINKVMVALFVTNP